jgi:murein L,D-transpeptidase YcbB/YkuD
MAALSDIKFNPYWNAPASIVERDIIPKLSSGILEKMNMKVFDGVGGPEVNPRRINWRRAVVDNYHFRQEPGGDNAMATAKINFPSPFGIYLHDTPEQHLFESGNRFYSSGCVRVQKVAILLNWILNGQDGFDPDRIENLAQSLERLDVTLVTPPQLRVAYLTAWPTSEGIVAFRGDVTADGTGFVVNCSLPVGERLRPVILS